MLRVIACRVGLGALLFFGAAGASVGCGTASVLECQAKALRILPPNPDEITVGVARELGRRIHACEQATLEQPSGDAGGD